MQKYFSKPLVGKCIYKKIKKRNRNRIAPPPIESETLPPRGNRPFCPPVKHGSTTLGTVVATVFVFTLASWHGPSPQPIPRRERTNNGLKSFSVGHPTGRGTLQAATRRSITDQRCRVSVKNREIFFLTFQSLRRLAEPER